jgi:hypothetical protein
VTFVEFPLNVLACYYGMGRYSYYVSPVDMTKSLKYLYGGVFLWYPAVTLIRISVAFALMRLRRGSKIWIRILWVTIVLQILVGTYGELFAFLQCRPLRALWERVPGAKCWVSKSSLVGGWIFSSMKHSP